MALVGLLTAGPPEVAGASDAARSARDDGRVSPAVASPCQASQLGARLAVRPPSAHREHLLLVLSNRGRRSCGMLGFVGLEMLGPDGSALATDPERAGMASPPMEVVVPPAGAAGALLSWTTFSADEACVAPAGVKVTPPSDAAGLVLRWPAPASLVCRFGHIDLEPIRPVSAARA